MEPEPLDATDLLFSIYAIGHITILRDLYEFDEENHTKNIEGTEISECAKWWHKNNMVRKTNSPLRCWKES